MLALINELNYPVGAIAIKRNTLFNAGLGSLRSIADSTSSRLRAEYLVLAIEDYFL